jgi:hypothetical protein
LNAASAIVRPYRLVALSLLLAGVLSAQTLQRGKEHYRAGRYVDAIDDLRAAAAAALTPEARQAYVATGNLASLAELEESLIYLALAYDRIGREAEARDAVTRLLNAEKIKPTYASLTLTVDAAGFEALAERLVPSIPLTPNPKLKSASGGIVVQPTLAQQRAEMMNLIEERVAAARAEIEKSANERVAAETAAANKAAEERIAAERAAAEKNAEERIAAGRAAAARSAEERIAAERAAAEKRAEEQIAAERTAAARAVEERIAKERAAAARSAEERIAAERAAAEKRAEEQIAAERTKADRDTASRIATLRAEVEKAAEQKIAEERAAMQRISEERVSAARAAAEKDAQERISAAEAERRRALLASLREAETLAIAGQLAEANRIYAALAQSPTSTREAIAAAAAGLYRTGAFQEAVRAFTRLGTLNKGEDDLRYYYAVSLYEIGRYIEARQELAAALPNLQRTDDVERYRAKIEQSAAQQAAKKTP